MRPATPRLLAIAVVVGSTVAAPAATAQPAPAPLPTAAGPVRIMPLGDSITWGTGSTPTCYRTRDCNGYRAVLRQLLTARGVEADFVGRRATGRMADPEHAGHPGWTVNQTRYGHPLAPRLGRARDWVVASRPDIILLHLGTNDVKLDAARYPRAKRVRIAREQASAPGRLSALIDDLRRARPTATVVVAAIAPSSQYSLNRNIRRYNAAVRTVVAGKRSARVRLVDMSGLDPISDMRDVLHPNARGYTIMAYRWYRALEPLLAAGYPARRWPDTGNPELADYRCSRTTISIVAGRDRYTGRDCRWWHLHRLTYRVDGRVVPRWTWRTQRAKIVQPGDRRIVYWSTI